MTQAKRSLQRHLLMLVLGVVASMWLATAVLTWFDVRHELDELLDGHLAQAAAILVVQQADEMGENGHGVDAPSLHRYAPKVAFQVFHAERLALRSANAPTVPMVKPGKTFEAGFTTVQIDGKSWRVFSALGSEPDVQVYVGEEANSRASILWAVLHSTLLPMAVALPLLALALWWAVSRGLAPMRQLGGSLARRQPDALDLLSVDGAPVEMTPVVDALNGLFGRIGALLESERRFTADASHELRTPIAAIRAQAQAALGATDDALRRHALTRTLEGCDRAIHLVEQLLTLSRLEASAAPTMEDTDLSAIARQVVADLAPKAIGKGQTMELEADSPCRIPGNLTLLSVLIRNLVDNAVRYSPPSARIHVCVQRIHGRVMLRVEDSGPGLTPADRGRLGERFFRAVGSEQDGSGLGWSIVRRIANVHHLDIRVEPSQSLGGLAVKITTTNALQKAGPPTQSKDTRFRI